MRTQILWQWDIIYKILEILLAWSHMSKFYNLSPFIYMWFSYLMMLNITETRKVKIWEKTALFYECYIWRKPIKNNHTSVGLKMFKKMTRYMLSLSLSPLMPWENLTLSNICQLNLCSFLHSIATVPLSTIGYAELISACLVFFHPNRESQLPKEQALR